MKRRTMLSAVAAGLVACGGPPPGIDAGPTDAPGDTWLPEGALVPGEGREVFEPIEEGRTLLLARGCQGSQHVWMAVRTMAPFAARGVLVTLTLTRVEDGTVVSAPFRIRLSFDPLDGSPGTNELRGLTMLVPNPEQALERDLLLTVEIDDRVGHSGSRSTRVRLAWGTEVCTG